jgi:hypothetical protein
MLGVLRAQEPAEDELPWELRVLGGLVAWGVDTPDWCERCGARRPELGRTACGPCLDARDADRGTPVPPAAAPVDVSIRGRTLCLLGSIAGIVNRDLVDDDLYMRQAVGLFGELCGHLLAGDHDAARDTVELLERLDRMVNDRAAL